VNSWAARGAFADFPPTPGALRAALAREFTPEELEAAGVLIPRQDGQLALSPVLACAGGHCLFQWRGRCEAPFDVVNRHRALVSDDPPAFQASRDFFTSKHLRVLKRRWILVVFSDEDLAVLRMLGVPCTPAAGLAQMTGRQARSLCEDPCDGLRPPSMGVLFLAISGCSRSITRAAAKGYAANAGVVFHLEPAHGTLHENSVAESHPEVAAHLALGRGIIELNPIVYPD
jgi:hypothetical protein